ncbi:MAG: hypothetical protein Ta2E_09810 [Mycoplasmoidaceae bacterium]|nr:MAG: hypothetical protein Ta2E_09810 [Mycoplasmoidaceae bacterium]
MVKVDRSVRRKSRRNHPNRINKQIGNEPLWKKIEGESFKKLMFKELFNSEEEYVEWCNENLDKDEEKELQKGDNWR